MRFLILVLTASLTAALAAAQTASVAGGAWQFLGPAPIQDSLDGIGPVGGNITALAFGPTGQIYVATGWGGVWESGDGGNAWAQISDAATAQFGAFTVNALSVSPDGALYAGTGSLSQPGLGAAGLLVTSNGGASWTAVGSFTGSSIAVVDAGITVNGSPGLAVTVAGPVDAGVWWTADGSNWHNAVPDVAAAAGYARLGANVWAAVEASGGWEVGYWASGLSAGPTSTVTLSFPGPAASVYLAASSHEEAALGLAADGTCVGVEVSSGGNQGWGPVAASGGCPPGDIGGPAALAFDSQGNLWLGGAGLWEWPAAASGWQAVPGVAGNVGVLAVAPPVSSPSLFAGSQDGVWRQSCGGTGGCTWQNATGNLAAVQVDSVAVTTAGVVWVAAAQGGVAGQPGWATALAASNGAQLAAAADDTTNGNRLYAVLPNATGIEVTSDPGASFQDLPFGSGGPSGGSSPLLAVNPANAGQLAYAAGAQLWQSSDGGTSWAPSGSPARASITALAMAAGANGVPPTVVAGDASGQVALDGGAWASLPVSSAVTAVAAAGGSAFAAAAGELFTAPATAGSWQAVSGAPKGTITALASDPADPQALYAGLATGGVYVSADGGQTWNPLGTGLPGVPVTALAVEMHARELIAATAGRGLWQTPLGNAAANVTISGAAAGAVGSQIPLTATVVNVIGQPVSGAAVNWQINGGAPSATSTTDAQGQAAYTLTLPPAAGTVTVTAWVAGSAQGGGTLTITAQAGAAVALAAVGGAGQNGIAAQALANPLVAEATDTHGNPVAGVTVTFSDAGAGGSFAPVIGQAVTGSDGRASVTYTLPAKVGAVTVTATAPNLPPAAFPETANPPPGFTLALTPQTVSANVATTATLTLTSSAVNGDTKTITLQCAAPVTGCNVTPGTISPGASATVSVATGSLALGNNSVVVRGSDGVSTAQATATVNVPQPDFTLTLTPSQPEAGQDSAFTLTAAAQPVNGAYAQIALSCLEPASGCTVSPALIAPGQSAVVTIAPGALPPGTAQVAIQGVDSTDQETHQATAGFTVVAAGLAVAAAPAALSLPAGGSGQVAVTATPQGGLTGLVALSCGGLPADAACTFSPPEATSTGGAVASTLVINTTADNTLPPPSNRPGPWPLAFILALGCAALAAVGAAHGRRRNAGGQRRRAAWAAAGFLGLALLAGCGGGGSAPADPPAAARSGTPPGSYTVQIMATSGKISSKTSITVQVN